MPSSIKFNGVRTFRPGIYAEIDASSLGGSGVSTGNVAVIGDFPLFEFKTPVAFESARALSNATLGDSAMQLLGKIAFSPASDDRVGGGASKLILVNAAPSTQASREFVDTSLQRVAFTMSAKLFGPAGNRVRYSLAQNASDYDLTLSYDGVSESYSGLGSTPFSVTTSANQQYFYSSESLIVRMRQKVATNLAQVEQVKVLAGFEALTPSKPTFIILDGVNEVAFGHSVTLTVEGTDASGVALTEALVIAQDATGATCTNEFSTVTKVTIVGGGAPANDLDVDIVFDQLNTDPAGYSSALALSDTLNNVPGMTSEVTAPGASGIPANALDERTFEHDGAAPTVSITAHTYSIVSTLNASSALVSAAAPLNGIYTKAPVGTGGTLSGGGAFAASTQGYQSALDVLLSKDVQMVVAMSESQAIHSAVLQHCKDAQVYGRERCGWVGAPALQTLDKVFSDYTSKLNSRHVALAAQSIVFSMPDGTSQTLSPMYLALMLACIQAGTSAGTPLTRKRPAVLDVIQHASWNPVLNANEALQKGIASLSIDNLGVLIERSITTYMSDDNPIFSEVSANESVNTSVRTLRARLESQIGNPVLAGTAAKIEGAVQINLARQVKDGVIKAFRNVVIEDLGDRFDINYDVAAVEPLNFIKITATVVRIPG